MKIRKWKCKYCKGEYLVSIKSKYTEQTYTCPHCDYIAWLAIKPKGGARNENNH